MENFQNENVANSINNAYIIFHLDENWNVFFRRSKKFRQAKKKNGKTSIVQLVVSGWIKILFFIWESSHWDCNGSFFTSITAPVHSHENHIQLNCIYWHLYTHRPAHFQCTWTISKVYLIYLELLLLSTYRFSFLSFLSIGPFHLACSIFAWAWATKVKQTNKRFSHWSNQIEVLCVELFTFKNY